MKDTTKTIPSDKEYVENLVRDFFDKYLPQHLENNGFDVNEELSCSPSIENDFTDIEDKLVAVLMKIWLK